MGEERRDARTTSPGRRFTVAEAAAALGISAEAVRSRLKRGTLHSVKDGATVYVLLEIDQSRPGTDQTAPELDQTGDQTGDQTELVEALREQTAYLQGVIATRDHELRERAEEIRRRDSALERQQELTAMFANRLRELEAPRASQESPPDTTTPQSATEDPHSEAEPIQRRSWWRRMFGG